MFDTDKLSVTGTAEGTVGVIHTTGYDCGVVDENTSDGDFVGGECKLGLGKGLEHEGFVYCTLWGRHLGSEEFLVSLQTVCGSSIKETWKSRNN